MATEDQSSVGLSSLAPTPGSRHRRKRKGIGEGSGNGKTCGKGQKGQKSRSGAKWNPGFEGGQMPLHRRLPKVGFISRKRTLGKNTYSLVTLEDLQDLSSEGTITLQTLRDAGFIRSRAQRVKILANGELTAKVTVEAHAASASAKAAIEKAGGSLTLVTE